MQASTVTPAVSSSGAVQASSKDKSQRPTGGAGVQRSGEGHAPSRQTLRGMGFEEGQAALAPVQAKNDGGGGAAAAAAATKKFGNSDPGARIGALHPAMQAKVRGLITLCHTRGLDVWVCQGLRTFAEQNELYKQGRTKKGPVVTYARGGQSYHNYGLAVDLCFHGKSPFGEEHDWAGLVQAVKDSGLESGIGWGDRPHAQIADIKLSQLQAWHGKGGIANVWNHVSDLLGGPKTDAGGEDQDEGAGEKTKPPVGGGGGGGTYTVKRGDTLIRIAERQLGDGDKWRQIAELNGVKDARDLQVGQILKMPKSAKPSGGKDDGSADLDAGFRETTHVVRPGETLTLIARTYYGMSSLWTEIAMANQIKDPTTVRVGQKLIIPVPGKAPKPAPNAIPITHVIAAGDTLEKIAQRYLGNRNRWKEIADANHISDTRTLKPGTKIIIPA